jgi:hypothetical protein
MPETYIATRLADGKTVRFKARDWADAEMHCEAAGYELAGAVYKSVSQKQCIQWAIEESRTATKH